MREVHIEEKLVIWPPEDARVCMYMHGPRTGCLGLGAWQQISDGDSEKKDGALLFICVWRSPVIFSSPGED